MRRVTILVLFLLVSLTWGTTWLAMRIAAETIPPVFATGMRFMFAAPFLISIAWLRKTPLLFPPGQRLFQLVICIFYFAINDLWWNLCQLRACLHYIFKHACGCFDGISYVFEWKNKLNADCGFNYRNSCTGGHSSRRNENKHRDPMAGNHCACFSRNHPCHNIYSMQEKKLYCLCYNV